MNLDFVARIVEACGYSMFCCALLCVHSGFAVVLVGVGVGAGCFAWFVFLVSRGGCVALPRGAVGLYAVCGLYAVLYWLPKLHKRPYKSRFNANSSACTTTELSILLTSCLIAIKNQGGGSVVVDFLFIITPILGVCYCSIFCCTLLYVHSSIAIILTGKRELIALLNLSSWCLVMVEQLFLAVPRGFCNL